MADLRRPHLKDENEDEEENELEIQNDPKMPRVIIGHKVCDKEDFAVGIDPCHIKYFSRVISTKLNDYILAVMCAKRTHRHRRMAEVILNELCNMTGERCTLDKPKNRTHRILTFTADKVALWLVKNIEDEDKIRHNRRRKEDAALRKRNIEKSKNLETKRKDRERMDKERETREKRKKKKEDEESKKKEKEKKEKQDKLKEKKEGQNYKEKKEKPKEKSREKGGSQQQKDKKPSKDKEPPKDKVQPKSKAPSRDKNQQPSDKDKQGQRSKPQSESTKQQQPKQSQQRQQQPTKQHQPTKQQQPTSHKNQQKSTSEKKPQSGKTPEKGRPAGEAPSSRAQKTSTANKPSSASLAKTNEAGDTPPQIPNQQSRIDNEPLPPSSEEGTEKEESQANVRVADEPQGEEEAPTQIGKTEQTSEEKVESLDESPKQPQLDEQVPDLRVGIVMEPDGDEPKAETPQPETPAPPPAPVEPVDELPKAEPEKVPEPLKTETSKEEPPKDERKQAVEEEILKKTTSEIAKTEPVSTPRQENLKDALSKELEKRISPKDDKEKEIIKEVSGKIATWVDKSVKDVEQEYGDRSKKGPPVSQKPKGPIFWLKEADSKRYDVRRASHEEAKQKTMKSRGRIHSAPAANSTDPMTSEDAKTWAKWAINASEMAEEWGKWIDKTVQDAEEKAVKYRSKGKETGKNIDVDKEDWDGFTGKTLEEALEWRRNKKVLEEVAKMWQKRSESPRGK